MWERNKVSFHMSGRKRSFVPGGHSGETEAGADGEEDVPLGVVGRIGNEIGSRRIEIIGERQRACGRGRRGTGAIHSVKLHAVDQVGVDGRKRIGVVGSVAIRGSVHGGRWPMSFQVATGRHWRWSV